ncbi:hypothetical protein MCOR27_010284 [Pyricularia oryzae]|uniref:Uncharacterized protein n=1 Tax=Pyricularia grisea TaxID=148305 RepID=A0ABQ8N943_PYRGI|nr:hypothetical protein MCOR27_010284 [Pyricularia oryzae]KAI6293300.1 hypothetical protein MCOR33_009253 [Pyricularia grisea]KAI6307464.1 hypothetical protein MCOR29_009683 [Pyricularia oryzae]KAI6356526.1 hypothetical protein MCOR31_010734 [Pyricularia oryzae]KAI6435327.1 hypothetical protein MCOR21_001837 [Pyricularia oryzae]
MDHSDDDEVQERDVTQLTEMGWTVRTFPGLNDSYTMTQMLHVLFNDFYMDHIPPNTVVDIYTPREMTPEQIEWLSNWQAWLLAPSDPPSWPEAHSSSASLSRPGKREEFSDDGGVRHSFHGGRKGIFGTLIDFFMPRRLTTTR